MYQVSIVSNKPAQNLRTWNDHLFAHNSAHRGWLSEWFFWLSLLGSLMWLQSSSGLSESGQSKIVFSKHCWLECVVLCHVTSSSRAWDSYIVKAALVAAKSQCASTYQVSASVTFANVSLDKASHMAKFEVTVRGDYTTMCILKVGFFRGSLI